MGASEAVVGALVRTCKARQRIGDNVRAATVLHARPAPTLEALNWPPRHTNSS